MKIKELYISDIDTDGTEEWSQEKIDKINYNFRLLANGVPPGPQGVQGVPGVDGNIGLTGNIGQQGVQGPDGPIGPDGYNIWLQNGEINNAADLNLTLKAFNGDISTSPLYATPHILLGFDTSNNVPNNPWNVGNTSYDINTSYDSNNLYISGNSELGNPTASLTLDESNTDISPSILKINAAEGTDGNLRTSIKLIAITDDTVTPHIITEALIGFKDIGGIDTFRIEAPLAIHPRINKFEIEVDDVSIHKIHISDNNDSEIQSSLINVENPMIISPSSTFSIFSNSLALYGSTSPIKVLKAVDNTGTTKWEEIDDNDLIGYKLPIGSITQVSSEIFNNDNYFENNYNDSTVYDNGYIESTIGRGIGSFSGWYVCNGYKWGNAEFFFGAPWPFNWSSPNQSTFYSTPNLNGMTFTYNSNSLSLTKDAGSDLRMMSGGELEVSTVDNGGGNYTATISNNITNTKREGMIGSGASWPPSTHDLDVQYKNNSVYIIYLGYTEYYQYINIAPSVGGN